MKKREKTILCYVTKEGNISPDSTEYCKTISPYSTLWAVYRVYNDDNYCVEFDYICKKQNIYFEDYKDGMYRGKKVYNNMDYIEKYRYKAV